MTFDPTSVEVLCVTLPKDHCIQVPWKYIKVSGYSDLFCKKKTLTKGHWPLDDRWPHICWGHICHTLPKDYCVKVPWEIRRSIWYSNLFFFKNLNQRSSTPRWHLTQSLLRSHVQLYPRIIVSKSHENTSEYLDTVTPFLSLTPRWPLTHVCCGPICDPTRVNEADVVHWQNCNFANIINSTWV